MELSSKARVPVEDELENWDDDDFEFVGVDLTSRSASIATAATNAPSHHRDSISSRQSFRSDFGDEERQLHLPGDDERSTHDAIAAATRAGIPIPQNVPSSALMGGTIKRLGGRKIRKIIQQDDWNDDLVLPGPGEELKVKNLNELDFPESLRQVSGGVLPTQSPVQSTKGSLIKPLPPTSFNLDKFRDEPDEDDDIFGDGGATIKVSKQRVNKHITNIIPPTPQKQTDIDVDDFESDFQLPSDGGPLRLSSRREIPSTPNASIDEFEDWGEGSLGTRFGGTKKSRSNRSSSASALSPSVASSLTVESEDEGLDGVVLPAGPINFKDALRKRQQVQPHEHLPLETSELPKNTLSAKDDFLAGLEIGDGDVFDSSKLTLNRNIKLKTVRQTSPVRPKTAVSLTFTNKPSPPINHSRLPRPLGHDRVSSHLEPVSETGGPIPNRSRLSQSRLGGHSAQSSITSIPTPTTPSSTHSMPPSTPRRRPELAQKSSLSTLRNEPTTTSAQLLKMKRSMPILRSHPQSPAKPMLTRYERPPSRTDNSNKAVQGSRPKTPLDRDRSGAESSLSYIRKNPLPFLPAGTSHSQSHHVTTKSSRHFRRHDSESSSTSADFRPNSRAVSRSTMRSPSPSRYHARGAEALAREAQSKKTMSKPRKAQNFGDGLELDGFDDLPTSSVMEQKFTRQPVGRGLPKVQLRNKIMQNIVPERTTTPVPIPSKGPFSPLRQDNLPRFARDTNASRMAREQVASQRTLSAFGAPPNAFTNQWRTQVPSKIGLGSTSSQVSRPKKKPVQLKPHLIKPLGNHGSSTKSVKGMVYNPATFRWEGNENDLSPFEAPSHSPSVASMPPFQFREKESSTPRPALITNVNAVQGVQVVGGMVFDPQRMCWLKVPSTRLREQSRAGKSNASTGDTMDGFDAFDDDDDEDVFKDVPDLEDKPVSSKEGFDSGIAGGRKSGGSEGGALKDDWLVGEEFDVGPEFVRRQREEEERWRRKCEKWIGVSRDAIQNEEWRWRIREVVNEL